MDFRCKKPEFAEYLDAIAAYDQQHRMGRTYWVVHDNKVVGYMTLAMGSASEEWQVDLGIDTYGPIPALAIVRLATDERYERQGVGRYMVSYATRLARTMGGDIGCRIVRVNSEPDVVGFYAAMGFNKFTVDQALNPSEATGSPRKSPGTAGDDEVEYVPMYLDMGQDKLGVSKNDRRY